MRIELENVIQNPLIESYLSDLLKSGALYVVEDCHTGGYRVQFDGMDKVIELQAENKRLRDKLESIQKLLG